MLCICIYTYIHRERERERERERARGSKGARGRRAHLRPLHPWLATARLPNSRGRGRARAPRPARRMGGYGGSSPGGSAPSVDSSPPLEVGLPGSPLPWE